MSKSFLHRLSSAFMPVLIAAVAADVSAETLVEYSAEARFQLDLHVADAPLAAMLPPGWTLNVATQGAA